MNSQRNQSIDQNSVNGGKADLKIKKRVSSAKPVAPHVQRYQKLTDFSKAFSNNFKSQVSESQSNVYILSYLKKIELYIEKGSIPTMTEFPHDEIEFVNSRPIKV